MEMKFCRRCGTELSWNDAGFYTCANNHTLYKNAVPCAGIFFLTDDDHILLSVRGIEPFKGTLDAFGGFVEEHESFEEALTREIQEELGLTPDHYDQPQFLCSSIGHYPYDGEDRSILGALFWARLKPDAKPVAADDVAEIRYADLRDVVLSEFGNDDTRVGIKKLQEMFL